MYLMLLAMAALLFLGIYQFTKGKRRRSKKKGGLFSGNKPAEVGTTKNGPVDYSWIPEETLQVLSRLHLILLRFREDSVQVH